MLAHAMADHPLDPDRRGLQAQRDLRPLTQEPGVPIVETAAPGSSDPAVISRDRGVNSRGREWPLSEEEKREFRLTEERLVESPTELLWLVLIGAFLLLLVAIGLIGIGTLVVAISKLAGVPLPAAHDDPARTEVLGLLQLAAYGLGAAALFAGAYAVGWRLAPPQHRPSLQNAAGRVAGAALLGLLAAGGVLVGIEDWNPIAFLSAIGFAYGAVRVARGSLFDDDENE